MSAASPARVLAPGVGKNAYRGRYAPSPSGWLHLGNARTALVAWLRARQSGGGLTLRIDDLDAPRTVPEAVSGNLAELRWLGLDWDEGEDVGGPHGPYRQSLRGERYALALERLEAGGAVYECYLSRKELHAIASAPHARAPVYGEAERRANAAVAALRRAEGRAASLRLRVDPGEIRFRDALAGPQRFVVGRDLGDIVLRRSDGVWAYQLATVVDDAAMGVTEVVRGDDLLPSTAIQLVLFRALGLAAPGYLHVPLLLDAAGKRLSKRRGSDTLHELKAAGVPPGRVVGLLAHSLGLLPEPRPATPPELLEGFDLAAVSTAPAYLDDAKLAWLGA